jgi:hypothetical protein
MKISWSTIYMVLRVREAVSASPAMLEGSDTFTPMGEPEGATT